MRFAFAKSEATSILLAVTYSMLLPIKPRHLSWMGRQHRTAKIAIKTRKRIQAIRVDHQLRCGIPIRRDGRML